MNKGTAIYQGETVSFTECLKNSWANRLEYLIVLSNKAIWVRDDELSAIIYIIN